MAASGRHVLFAVITMYALAALIALVFFLSIRRVNKGVDLGGGNGNEQFRQATKSATAAAAAAASEAISSSTTTAASVASKATEETAAAASKDIQNSLAERCFSFVLDQYDADAASNGQTVQRRRELQSDLLGPIVPVDCSTNTRYCVKADNCRLFCKDAAVVNFECNHGVCVQSAVDPSKPGSGGGDGGDSADSKGRCDTKNGEYGLLVGYNELGIAQWECIQLYPAWQRKDIYCENGRIDIDVRAREPSYRDCICQPGDVRLVYQRSVLGQTVYGLPHCVPADRVKFYELSYTQM